MYEIKVNLIKKDLSKTRKNEAETKTDGNIFILTQISFYLTRSH